MADRKPTVLNPAGYQENLQDTDNLIVEAAPTANNHAVNKEFVDDLKLVIDGDIAAAGKWEESNGNLYPKTLTNNVGIGTDSPSTTLELGTETPVLRLNGTTNGSNVYGDIRSTGNGFEFLSRGGLSSFGSYAFYNYDGTTESIALKIKSDGNVGIGTNAPASLLTLKGGGTSAGDVETNKQFRIKVGDNDNYSGTLSYGKKVGDSTYYALAIDAVTNTVASDILLAPSGGNVGIGTDSPSGKLDVQTGNNERVVFDSAGSTSPRISLTRDTGSNYNFVNDLGVYRFYKNETIELYRYTSDNHIWSTEASGEVARFSSNGNVGIGTTAPYSKLTVREQNGTAINLDINSTDTGSYSSIAWTTANLDLGAQPGAEIRGYRTAPGALGELAFHTRGQDNLSTERVRISDVGNVGIGTDDPIANLEIANTPLPGVPTLYLSQAPSVNTTSDIALTGNSAIRSEVSIRNVVNTGGFFSWLVGGDDNKAGTDGASEVMRITPVGNVGIGTNAPESRLTINPGNSSNTSIGGRGIAYGVNAITTSGRSGFLVRNSNNFLQDNDNSAFQFLYPFDDGITSDYKVFRTAKGSTLSDVFWTSINGNGYFAGNVGIGTDSPAEKLHVAGNIKADNFDIGGITKDSYLRSDADDSASGNLTFNGRTNIRGNLDISDGQNVDFGSSDDIKFYYQGSNDWLYCDFKTAGNGIIFKDAGTDKMVLEDSGVFRPATNNTGNIGNSSNYWSSGYFLNFNVSSTLNVRGAIDLADNDKIRFGSGDDTEMYYNGSHTYIDLKTEGNFYIRDGTTSRFFVTRAGNATLSGKLTAGNFDLESLPALP